MTGALCDICGSVATSTVVSPTKNDFAREALPTFRPASAPHPENAFKDCIRTTKLKTRKNNPINWSQPTTAQRVDSESPGDIGGAENAKPPVESRRRRAAAAATATSDGQSAWDRRHTLQGVQDYLQISSGRLRRRRRRR